MDRCWLIVDIIWNSTETLQHQIDSERQTVANSLFYIAYGESKPSKTATKRQYVNTFETKTCNPPTNDTKLCNIKKIEILP